MPRDKENILYYIATAVVFILLETAALAMIKYNGSLQDTWLARTSHVVMANIWGTTEAVTEYFSLKKENDRLREENYFLSKELYRYAVDTTGHSRKADTIGSFSMIPAEIRKISNNRQHNYIIISKGSEDGVSHMSGLITDQGIIGIVDAVGPHYSYALSFKNDEVEVSARLGREGAVGELTWDGIHDRGAVLNGIPNHIEIEPGDTVFSSGYSSIFPPDIPLGITGEKTIINGVSYRIKVELFEDFSSLRHVTVVKNIDIAEVQMMEQPPAPTDN